MKAMSINEKLRDDLHDQLFKAILELKSMEECYEFFEDICTIQEMKSIAARLEVARTATISRVKRCLNYGTGGYDIVLERLGMSRGIKKK